VWYTFGVIQIYCVKGLVDVVNGRGNVLGYVRSECAKMAGSVRRLASDWFERYTASGAGNDGIPASGFGMSLKTAAKGIVFAVLAFFMAIASLGSVAGVSAIAGSGLVFDSRPLGMALLCASGMYTPFVWAGVIFASLFLGGLAIPSFLCSCFALAMRIAFALWLAPSRRQKKRGNAPYTYISSGRNIRYFEEPLMLRVGLALGCAALISVYRIISGGFLWYDILSGLCELCALPLFTFIFAGALDRDKRFTASYEAGIFGIMFAVVVSLREYMPFGFSLSSVAAALITLFVSKTGGVLRGGIAGLVTGLAASPVYSPALGIAGIAAGLCQSAGAAASSALASVAGMACGIALDGFSALRIFAPDILAGAVIFTPLAHFELLPRIILYSGSELPADLNRSAVIQQRARADTVSRINAVSDAMGELSEVFYSLSDRLRRPGLSDIRRLCDRTFDRYCRKCSNYAVCWEKENSSTSDVTASLASRLMRGDLADTSCVPGYFAERCSKLPELIEDLNRGRGEITGELLKCDNTRVFAMDYDAMSKLLEYAVRENTSEFEIDTRLCSELEECARCVGLYASSIAAYGTRRKTVIAGGIDMTRANAASDDIRKAFSHVTGCRMSDPEYTVDGEYVSMTLTTQRSFDVEYARASDIARAEKERKGSRVSGDTITSFDNAEDYRYVLISDGMGSGREAALTSRTAGIFLEKLLSCGNSKAVALEMLNNFIRSKNLESFATVDLLEVDLVNGNACFIKSGAAPSYVLRGRDLFKIASNTMPVGITRELNAEEIRFTLRDGDIVVMVSDGVAQSFEDGVWLASMLASEWDDRLSLSESAERILARAKADRRRADDMTVGIVRIREIA